MAPLLRHSFCIVIANIFYLIMTATVFADPVEEDTIEISNEVVSPDLQPLLLYYYPLRATERFHFVLPEKSGDAVNVSVESGSELWLMCSSASDAYRNFSEANIKGQVILKNKSPASDVSWQLSHVKCSNKVTASTLNTKTDCGGANTGTTGVLFKIGFWILVGHERDDGGSSSSLDYQRLQPAAIEKKRSTFGKIKKMVSLRKESQKGLAATEFLSLYESCYDASNKVVLFTKYSAHGSSFAAKERLDAIPVLPDNEWSYGDEGTLFHFLVKENQSKMFNILLRGQATHFNDRATRYLLPMQIVSPIDMVFYPWRSTLFTELNLTSVWESILGRGWRMIEKAVNAHILSENNYDFTIATGVSKILNLENQGIYLEVIRDSRFRGVPRFVWKILFNWNTGDAVVFVISNNPHSDVCEDSICPNRCREGGYVLPLDDPWTGCVHCCSYQDASSVLNLPSLVRASVSETRFLRFNPGN